MKIQKKNYWGGGVVGSGGGASGWGVRVDVNGEVRGGSGAGGGYRVWGWGVRVDVNGEMKLL